jgi:signal peptidase II
MKKTLPYLALIAGIVILDQVTKWMLVRSVPYGTHKVVIPGFFNLSHVRNRGAIFGLFSQSGSPAVYVALTVASLGALVLVLFYFIKVPVRDRLLKVTLSLILGGALGNQVDRLFQGYVVDFVEVYVKSFHWPSFNVADSCITIGAILLVYIFFFRKGEKCSLCS